MSISHPLTMSTTQCHPTWQSRFLKHRNENVLGTSRLWKPKEALPLRQKSIAALRSRCADDVQRRQNDVWKTFRCNIITTFQQYLATSCWFILYTLIAYILSLHCSLSYMNTKHPWFTACVGHMRYTQTDLTTDHLRHFSGDI